MTTDAHLIAAARTDPRAFAELYRRHARAVDSFLSSRMPAGDASELTAETFAQAALSLRRFRDERNGSARPWLLGIARNLVRTYYERERVERRARERLGMPLRSYELDLDGADARLDAERLAPELGDAVRELPESQRQALEQRVLQERPFAEVATTLGCSEVAARIRVSRALDTLSRRLKGATP
ncbi:MAG TPA: sigma-70 family RNA polymerase sigma factor [Gaiellaceae bacterium]|nr:sigma-70 family RNA polymerase sigma factor [Gaiellaceae bacterium]